MGVTTILSPSALATPAISTVTSATTGGTLPAAATHSYRVSAINDTGETLASTAATVVTGAGATNANTVNWGAVPLATGYRVYGRTSGGELRIAQVGAVTSYVDTGNITPAGALPTQNTTNGTAPATSSDVVVPAGATVILSAYVDSGSVPRATDLSVYMATPGADVFVGSIRDNGPLHLSNPTTTAITYRVRRNDLTSSGYVVGAIAIS